MTLEERIEDLEHEVAVGKSRNRRRLVVGIAILFGWTFSVVWATSRLAGGTHRIIHARGFIAEDENGKVRAQLVTDKARTTLSLYNAKGELCAGLGVTGIGSTLTLSDENGKLRAGLVASTIKPVLSLCDDNGKIRAQLAAGGEGPALSLSDEKGEWCVLLAQTKERRGLALFDEKGKLTWTTP